MTSGLDAVVIPQSFGQDAKIKGLKLDKDPQSPSSPDNIIWKDLGQYLETLTEVPSGESKFKNDLKLEAPLNTTIQYRVCTLCNRPILTHHLGTHIKKCLHMKQQKERATATMIEDKIVNGKKRKLEKDSTPSTEEVSTPKSKPKKPKKDPIPKPKKKAAPKNKGPVDVEKQCGVLLPGGGLCARSLTCKTHSMGAKRAVPGRSASYDELLAAYQHRNQVKIAGQAAKAQEAKDELLHASTATLDSDEETQQVLGGVSRSFPLPLERKTLVPTRVRTNFLRMREMFAGAMLPRITNSNGVGGLNGRTAILDVDHANDYFFVVRAPQRMMFNKSNVQQNSGNQAQTVKTPPQNTPGAAAAALAQQQQVQQRQMMAQQAARQKMLQQQQLAQQQMLQQQMQQQHQQNK